jgi:hypothetical protein
MRWWLEYVLDEDMGRCHNILAVFRLFFVGLDERDRVRRLTLWSRLGNCRPDMLSLTYVPCDSLGQLALVDCATLIVQL